MRTSTAPPATGQEHYKKQQASLSSNNLESH